MDDGEWQAMQAAYTAWFSEYAYAWNDKASEASFEAGWAAGRAYEREHGETVTTGETDD